VHGLEDLPVMERASRRQFSALVARPDPQIDLAHAALLIATEEYPELDVDAYRARLDAMGQALAERLQAAEPLQRVRALSRYLFEEEGFRGNTEDYYDPRNSFLNEVLDRRTGIPISLSTIYIEVARRAGLVVEGVGLPGHFIVRVASGEGDFLVDPFHSGALLSHEDCQKRLDRVYGGRVRMELAMLAVCSRRQILARMLRNLKAIYLKAEDQPRALAVVDLLLRTQPESVEDLRDRGLLHASLDCYAAAVRDLEAYLEKAPGAPEAQSILERVAELRHLAARLN
jgi:regulator of sirC expression with transglutaminase-like and TPR domain